MSQGAGADGADFFGGDSYTVMTVFENTDSINEPVISLPMAGRASFRQIGILAGLALVLPMAIYSSLSEPITDAWPDPIVSVDAVAGTRIHVTWDVVLSLMPVPFGIALGVPRPKLVPMDKLVAFLVVFWVRKTSVSGPLCGGRGRTAPGAITRLARGGRSGQKKRRKPSMLAGFARRGPVPGSGGRGSATATATATTADGDDGGTRQTPSTVYPVSVTDLWMPKSVTITLYDDRGVPMRGRPARIYIDGMLVCAITTDQGGVIGMTFVPRSEGPKDLVIRVDGDAEDNPAVRAILDVRRGA